LAFGVIRHFWPRQRFLAGNCGAGGVCFVGANLADCGCGYARPDGSSGCGQNWARHVHDRLPQEIRERLPEELRLKITGS